MKYIENTEPHVIASWSKHDRNGILKQLREKAGLSIRQIERANIYNIITPWGNPSGPNFLGVFEGGSQVTCEYWIYVRKDDGTTGWTQDTGSTWKRYYKK